MGGGSIRWILVLGALIRIWRPEIADGHNISCWLIWQEIFSFHKDILNQVLEKTLESPLDCKEIQSVHSEGDQPWDFFGRNDTKAETPVLWPPHAKSWLWCWEGLGAGGEGDDRGWDGWMASLTRWTWVSVNSGSWCWIGRPGVLRFMGSQRVRHDWATDLIWSDLILNQGVSQVVLVVKNPPGYIGDKRDSGLIPGSGRSPRRGSMATHSGILARRIPWTEGPGGLQSMELQRVVHDWSELAHTQHTKSDSKKIFFSEKGYMKCCSKTHSKPKRDNQPSRNGRA